MAATALRKTEPEMMTKSEVCEYLGKSRRSLANYMAEGRLPGVYVTGPNGKEARFARVDVERMKRDLDTPLAVPATKAVTRTADAAPAIRMDEHFARLVHALSGSRDVHLKPWLTLAQAVEYSGLPSAFLLAQARAGAIRAVNVGTGAREFWRFNRDALAK